MIRREWDSDSAASHPSTPWWAHQVYVPPLFHPSSPAHPHTSPDPPQKSAALAALRDKRTRQAKARDPSPEALSRGTSDHHVVVASKILAPESSPSGPESKYYSGTAVHRAAGPGAAAIVRHSLFGDTEDIASQSLNKPRSKPPSSRETSTQEEREAARRSEQVMQGLQGMAGAGAGAGVPQRPDSRPSTYDGDGLPPRKKQAFVPSSQGSPSASASASRSGSAALEGKMASGLRVSTPACSDEESGTGPPPPPPPPPSVGFGSRGGPQRVSLARGTGTSGAGASFSAAVSTPNRQRLPGTGFTSSSLPTTDILNPDRLKSLFPEVPTQVIEETIIEYGDEPPVEIIKRIRAAQTGVPYRAPGVASVKTIKPVAARASVPLRHAASSPTGGGEPVFSTPGKPTPTPTRKHPKVVSAIYANRSERRPTQPQAAMDVDGGASSPAKPEPEVEAVEVVSDEAVTEDEESDAEGGRGAKEKLAVDEDGQDMDEVKALEEFNTCTAETLTGTIGELTGSRS